MEFKEFLTEFWVVFFYRKLELFDYFVFIWLRILKILPPWLFFKIFYKFTKSQMVHQLSIMYRIYAFMYFVNRSLWDLLHEEQLKLIIFCKLQIFSFVHFCIWNSGHIIDFGLLEIYI